MIIGDGSFGAMAWADAIEATGEDGNNTTPDVSTSGNKIYIKMQKVAHKVLKHFVTGRVVLWSVTVTETGNPAEPYHREPTQKERYACVLGYSDERIAKSNGNILASDRRVILDSTGIRNYIKNLEYLTIDGVHHTIVQVKPIPAAGVASVYVVQARTANQS